MSGGILHIPSPRAFLLISLSTIEAIIDCLPSVRPACEGTRGVDTVREEHKDFSRCALGTKEVRGEQRRIDITK